MDDNRFKQKWCMEWDNTREEVKRLTRHPNRTAGCAEAGSSLCGLNICCYECYKAENCGERCTSYEEGEYTECEERR